MRALRILVLSIAMASTANAAMDVCTQSSALDSLSRIERLAYDYFGEPNGFGPNEISLGKRVSIYSLVVANRIGKRVGLLTTVICQAAPLNPSLNTMDNEVDALRHFTATATLSFLAPNEARMITTAHEIRGLERLREDDLMDLYNNRLGHEFGENLLKNQKTLEEDEIIRMAVEEAFVRIKNIGLKTLTHADSGPCQNLADKTETEFRELVQKSMIQAKQIERRCRIQKVKEPICAVLQAINPK